ncbi:hypothetical protein E2C01_064538 [Portunus trituberculatus]|uniref:Uncharacterized protein n=1 Tax=Portunus trituberculatus TaxID=210409 RepID=A0A5B7HP18_PORTR|nr:hypothetical protein [Portunus trituberculatus]
MRAQIPHDVMAGRAIAGGYIDGDAMLLSCCTKKVKPVELMIATYTQGVFITGGVMTSQQ